MTTLTLGAASPLVSLLNQDSELFESKSLLGKKNLVVYFYPKALTPGCTTQACGIHDYQAKFEALDTIVVGVSPDVPEKLRKFAEKYGLEFPLLSDTELKAANDFGVWGMKKFMGREFMGIIRTSFIIDKKGTLRHIIEKVNTKTHNDELIAYIKDNL